MARTDRLMRLMDALRRLPAPVTAARLADETGVSPRQLYRDIATLRASGALIDGEAGVGYRLTEDPALPPQSFNRLEIEALRLAVALLPAEGGDRLRQDPRGVGVGVDVGDEFGGQRRATEDLDDGGCVEVEFVVVGERLGDLVRRPLDDIAEQVLQAFEFLVDLVGWIEVRPLPRPVVR